MEAYPAFDPYANEGGSGNNAFSVPQKGERRRDKKDRKEKKAEREETKRRHEEKKAKKAAKAANGDAKPPKEAKEKKAKGEEIVQGEGEEAVQEGGGCHRRRGVSILPGPHRSRRHGQYLMRRTRVPSSTHVFAPFIITSVQVSLVNNTSR